MKSPVAAQVRRARMMLKEVDARKPIDRIDYPVQAVRFGRSLTLVALGGEVDVDYALRIKREYPGEPIIVAGYSNDVMSLHPVRARPPRGRLRGQREHDLLRTGRTVRPRCGGSHLRRDPPCDEAGRPVNSDGHLRTNWKQRFARKDRMPPSSCCSAAPGRSGRYRDVFATRLMQARRRMGLPLIETEPSVDLPDGQRAEYEKSLQDAARETGELFLAAGDIISAWPYFRAIGETAPVSAALENARGTEHLDGLIDIAFREQVNPRRGFELILEHRGICNAITWFGAMPEGESRRECLRLLVRNLYHELAAALRRHIEKVGRRRARYRKRRGVDRRPRVAVRGQQLPRRHDASHLGPALQRRPGRPGVDAHGARDGRVRRRVSRRCTTTAAIRRSTTRIAITARTCVRCSARTWRAASRTFAAKQSTGAQAGYMLPAEIFIDLLVRLDRFDEAIAASIEFFPETGSAAPDELPVGAPAMPDRRRSSTGSAAWHGSAATCSPTRRR